MAKITYGQRGYVGSSMSVRQREAYDSGEMPLSKWTKAVILAEVSGHYPQSVYAMVSKWPAQDLRDTFLRRSSWHHTGKYANRTDFYSFLDDVGRDYLMTRDRTIAMRIPAEKPVSKEVWVLQSWEEWTVTRSGRKKAVTRRTVCSYIDTDGKKSLVTCYDSPGSKMREQKRYSSLYRIVPISKPRSNSKVWQEVY